MNKLVITITQKDDDINLEITDYRHRKRTVLNIEELKGTTAYDEIKSLIEATKLAFDVVV